MTIAAAAPTGPAPNGPGPTGPARTSARGRGRRVLVGLLLVMIVAGSVLIAHLGCERMRVTEPVGMADASGRVVAGYGWSLHPLGFTVRYVDGAADTRLWW